MWGRFTKSGLQLDWVLSCRIPCVKPLLNKTQPQKRLAWAKDKKDWTAVELCSLILHFLWKSRSQSLEEERRGTESTLLEVQCKVSTVSDGLGCHVICWCWSTVFSEVQGQRSHLPGSFRAFPAADQLYGDADFIFQQDLAPAHSAKATSTWFKDHGIPVLNWPANLPDLNPIENLWGIVKRKMRYARPKNAEELKATIRATWALITPEQCHRLIDSMPRRIAAVIQAKGAPTEY
uniref:Tc1-like transposase DDE domain-containing protein n=1 Tax=Esox lucius TaxID=8010 RepID=A0AAY5KSN5_ESOLU